MKKTTKTKGAHVSARPLSWKLGAASLALAGLLCSTEAEAIDFKVSGMWQILTEVSNVTPRGVNGADNFGALQRFRIQLDAVASESLSGTVQFELGRTEWGQASTGGALGTDGQIVEVRHAFIDWVVPNTQLKLRMGLQPLMLPGAVSGFSAVFCHDMAGISATTPLYRSGDVSADLSFFWARPYNDNSSTVFTDRNTQHLDNMDVFALSLPVTWDKVKVNPWVMYALIGKYSLSGLSIDNEPAIVAPRGGLMPVLGSNNYASFQKPWLPGLDRAWGDGFWFGSTIEIEPVDDLKIFLEGSYGSVTMGEIRNYTGFGDTGRDLDLRRAGWYAAARVNYAFDWGTLGVLGWYGSGDDDNPYNGSERLPQYNTPWMVSSLGFGGSPIDEAAWKVLGSNPGGLAAAIVELKDVSFVEDLKHTLRFCYYWGTNSPEMPEKANMSWPTRADGPMIYLTTKDTAWEVNLTTEYKIYENLSVNVDAAYVRVDADSDTWHGAEESQYKDNYRFSVLFTYSF